MLIVDDEGEQREGLLALLEQVGCRVDVAADGKEAVSQANALRPNVVLLDMGLPVIDGWQVIEMIRGSRVRVADPNPNPRPHIIVLSAYADANSRRLAFEMGCDEYLVKPADVRGVLWAFINRRPGSFAPLNPNNPPPEGE